MEVPGIASTRKRFIDRGAPAEVEWLSAWDNLVDMGKSFGLPDLRVHILEDFILEGDDQDLNKEQRAFALAQAKLLIENLYPHLPYKKDLFPSCNPEAIFPELARRIEETFLHGSGFHIEMHRLCANVFDPHTHWRNTAYYQDAVAFLPFQIGFYTDEKGRNRYIVTEVMEHFDDSESFPSHFKPGAELLSMILDGNSYRFNDPKAISGARLSPGSNEQSQLLRGVQRHTLRSLSSSWNATWQAPFKDSQVDAHFNYSLGEQTGSVKFRWAIATGMGRPPCYPSGTSINPEMQRTLTATEILFRWEEVASVDLAYAANRGSDTQFNFNSQSRFPDAFQFITSGFLAGGAFIHERDLVSDDPTEQFGYLRIRSFLNRTLNPEADLVEECRRILTILNRRAPNGLIIDIRGNPGGLIRAAECMLEMLTPRKIQPLNFHLANTPAVQEFLRTLNPLTVNHTYAKIAEDFRNGLVLNDRLTTGAPLTNESDGLNTRGQIYHGPVLLLVDALSYSAADLFAAGFQDNQVGPIWGQDSQTGAGGASVLSLNDLATLLQGGSLPLAPSLPLGCDLTLAFLRASRVGLHQGEFIEDVGVKPDEVRPRTRDDLLEKSKDLIRAACRKLSSMPRFRMVASGPLEVSADGMVIELTTVGVDRLDILINGQPFQRDLEIAPGEPKKLLVPYPEGLGLGLLPITLRLEGRLSTSDRPSEVRAVSTFYPRQLAQPRNLNRRR